MWRGGGGERKRERERWGAVCAYVCMLRWCCISDFRVSGEDLKAIFMEILFTELSSAVTQIPGPG